MESSRSDLDPYLGLLRIAAKKLTYLEWLDFLEALALSDTVRVAVTNSAALATVLEKLKRLQEKDPAYPIHIARSCLLVLMEQSAEEIEKTRVCEATRSLEDIEAIKKRIKDLEKQLATAQVTIHEVTHSDDQGQALVIEQQVHVEAGAAYEREWHSGDFERVALLIETLSGNPEIEFEGLPGQYSNWERAKFFAGRVRAGTKRIAIRIKSNVAAKVRVTVAFLKREGQAAFVRMSCKSCKAFCRLAVNGLLVHLGVPPLLDLDVPIPEGPASAAGQHLTEICHTAGQVLPEGLVEFFDGVSREFWSALQAALTLADWLTEGVDGAMETVCRGLHCCK